MPKLPQSYTWCPELKNYKTYEKAREKHWQEIMQQTEQFKMTLMLELSKELKITIINVKSYHWKGKQHEQIGNFSREKYWKSNGMLEIKNMVTETKKTVFYGLISRHKIAEEGIWWHCQQKLCKLKHREKKSGKNQKKSI